MYEKECKSCCALMCAGGRGRVSRTALCIKKVSVGNLLITRMNHMLMRSFSMNNLFLRPLSQ